MMALEYKLIITIIIITLDSMEVKAFFFFFLVFQTLQNSPSSSFIQLMGIKSSGYLLLTGSALFFILSMYAIVFSKLLPPIHLVTIL